MRFKSFEHAVSHRIRKLGRQLAIELELSFAQTAGQRELDPIVGESRCCRTRS